MALVAGEAGIGKSSVVTEFTRRAATTARVLWGACDQLGHTTCSRPAARHRPRDRGRPGPAAGRHGCPREEIYSAFLDEVTDPQQRHRALVVVEDAHWADEATLDWLTFLGRRITRLPVLLVVTYRDDEVGPDHPLRRVLAAMPSDATTRHRPGRPCRRSASSRRPPGPVATPAWSAASPAATRCWSPSCSRTPATTHPPRCRT